MFDETFFIGHLGQRPGDDFADNCEAGAIMLAWRRWLPVSMIDIDADHDRANEFSGIIGNAGRQRNHPMLGQATFNPACR